MVEYQAGHDITNRHEFVRIDQKFWTVYNNGSPDFRYSIKDAKTFDQMIERAHSGFVTAHVNGRPALIMKTMIRNTGGKIENIPRTSVELTGEMWEPFDGEGDTAFFVTCTIHDELQDYKIGGKKRLSDSSVSSARKYYRDKKQITYSPCAINATLLHIRNGALPVTYISGARPGIVIFDEPAEDVVVWGYQWKDYDFELFDFLNKRFKGKTRGYTDLRQLSPYYREGMSFQEFAAIPSEASQDFNHSVISP